MSNNKWRAKRDPQKFVQAEASCSRASGAQQHVAPKFRVQIRAEVDGRSVSSWRKRNATACVRKSVEMRVRVVIISIANRAEVVEPSRRPSGSRAFEENKPQSVYYTPVQLLALESNRAL